MKTAKFQYKCRLCGEVYDEGAWTSEENAGIILICTIIQKSVPKKFSEIQPDMVGIHVSCKVGRGVSDLIGYVVEEEEKE